MATIILPGKRHLSLKTALTEESVLNQWTKYYSDLYNIQMMSDPDTLKDDLAKEKKPEDPSGLMGGD